MAQANQKIRLFVVADLGADFEVILGREQTHYLVNVMRREAGDSVRLFNGRDGEWRAEIAEASKREVRLLCTEKLRPQVTPPDLWLAFAPVKKARTDFIAEKACEMGCQRVLPVFTDYTNSERVNIDRLQAHAVEAAEQCGLLSVPEMIAPQPLSRFLDGLDGRKVLFCDESGAGAPAMEVLRQAGPGPWVVLIGPEGGFSEAEAERLRARPDTHAVSLGPRILRADTAAVAALTVWQAAIGDWSGHAAP
ncbi:16S rRNA (uracil(1498)-N(3))-methyltransferase [Rhodobacteraceae bacterium NNCM2]|nr:16S rRNA (uracil(1498)-N(3))-methyltransferase [Coraliihabitans acroporae]